MTADSPPDSVLLERLKGRTVVDRTTNRTGVVMDVIGGSAYLRPVGGGVEWQRSPALLAPAGAEGE